MQPVVIGDVIWEPSQEVIDRSRLKQFMDRHGIETFHELLRRADADIEWFWDAAIKDIDVAFYRQYDQVVDLSQGKPWAKWWVGGRMNIIQSCLDRHRDGEFRDKTAIIWEGEPGEVRKLSYGELDRQTSRLAGALRRLGVRQGDRIGIFMPMCPEVAISVLATAKVGAVIIPLFSGYGPEAIATRLRDGEAKVLICADGFYRRGQVVPMKETADRALVSCPTVRKVIVHRRIVREVPWTHGRDEVWEVLLEDDPDRARTEELDPEDPLMIIYTSGTTGKPKGTLHVHGGFPVKAAQDMAHGFHGRPDDTIKVAGKRLGPAEVESILVGNVAVAEAAAIGVPDELKGEALVVFVILRPNHQATDQLAVELQDLVAGALGKPLRPKAVHFVTDLPRTRNAKILRRVVRSVYTGKDPGDLTALENPAALEAI